MAFRYNADPSKRKQRIHVKYMFVCRTPSSKKTMTALAILTDDNRFVEYELSFKSQDITLSVAKRLRSLFAPFQISSTSEIVFSRDYEVESPLYQYMLFLQPHMGFNMRTVTVEVILRGISSYHSSYLKAHGTKITKYHTNELWSQLVSHGVCPWINEKFDTQIEKMSLYKRRDKKIVRLGMYYLVVKNYKDAIWRRSIRKKQLRLNSSLDQ